MRRRLQKFLPVVLTALVVQILAPVAACWAASALVSDPLTAEICHSTPVSVPGDADQGGGSLHAGVDFACCVLHVSASIEPPVATFASPFRDVGRVVWAQKKLRLFSVYSGSNAQARAPPHAL